MTNNDDKQSRLAHNPLTGIALFAGILSFSYGLVGGDAYLIADAILSSGALNLTASRGLSVWLSGVVWSDEMTLRNL